jgi:hypothetical protein
MSAVLRSLLAMLAGLVLLAISVIVEVVLAMIAYMYLALNHSELFGQLVLLSRDVLNAFANQLEAWAPHLTNRAYSTLLGELGPKSILLLLIGLTVSAFGRLIAWLWRRLARKREHATAGSR